MESKRLRNLLGSLRHPSGADLLMYIDGELSARKSRQVRQHLLACWQCRLEQQKMGQAINEFLECRNSAVGKSPPLRGWSRFGGRLSAAAAEEEPRPFWKILWRSPRIGFAAAAAMAMALVIWAQLHSVPTVSASTLLSRAEAAEQYAGAGIRDSVVYRRIALRRHDAPQRAGQSGELESWADWRRSRFERRSNAILWPELEQILRRNHMDRHLLSASSFEEWRNSVPLRTDNVTGGTLADGNKSLTLETVTAGKALPGAILEARLVVRAGDWRPVRQSLRVQGERDVQVYELQEISSAVVPASSLDASIFGPPPIVQRPAALPPAPAPLSAAVADLSETRIQALYALHKARACLGENVEATRNASGQLVVQGEVETPERKEQLQAVLQPIHGVVIQIRTFADAEPASTPVRTVLAAESVETGGAAEGRVPAIQRVLKGRAAGDAIVELSWRAVSLSEAWISEAWALRHLTNAFAEDDLRKLSDPGRRMLAEMIRDHAASLQSKIAECRIAFQPYLSGEPVEEEADTAELEWPQSAGRLFTAAAKAAELARALCAGSALAGAEEPDPIRHLVATLAGVQGDAGRLDSGILALLQSRPRPLRAETRKEH